jgi:hypothetical protein
VRHGIPRRIRARHPTRMRVYIRKSSYGMQQLINQAINQQQRRQQQLASRSGNRQARTHAISGIKHDFQWIGSARAPSA